MPRPMDYGSHIDVIGNVFPPLPPPGPLILDSPPPVPSNAGAAVSHDATADSGCSSIAKDEIAVGSAQDQNSAPEGPIAEPPTSETASIPIPKLPAIASSTAMPAIPASATKTPSPLPPPPLPLPPLVPSAPSPVPLPGGYDAPAELLAWLAAPGPDGKPDPPIFVGFGSMV